MNLFLLLAVIILGVTSSGLLLSKDWRISLGLLGVQYIGVLWLVAQHWPVSMASIKLITGWMAIAILGITRLGASQSEDLLEGFWSQGRLFRLIAASFIIIIDIAVAPRVDEIIPGIGLEVISGSILLISMGLLQLGISSQPVRVILGLLTVISGFEIIYAALESSLLVAALLSVVSLGLALAGAYLLSLFEPEEIS
jgi:hypothetical protein